MEWPESCEEAIGIPGAGRGVGRVGGMRLAGLRPGLKDASKGLIG
jgi:hypothetical protein